MNIEERAAQAAAWKAAGQCNCAQAVMKAFEDKIPVDADTLMKLGVPFEDLVEVTGDEIMEINAYLGIVDE